MDSTNKSSIATKLLAGGIAGASETMITYPAEFIKTHRQLPSSQTSITSAKPSTALTILRRTYTTSGLRGFYSGCGALATGNFLKSGIRFFAFETTREQLDILFRTAPSKTCQGGQITTIRSPWINVLAGLSAGVAESMMVVTPGEVLKTRMVEDAARKSGKDFAGRGSVGVALHVVKMEGVRALWKGAVPVMSKQATNSAVRFTTFAMMQEQVAKRWPTLSGNVSTTLGIGAVSGVITVYASMPFDNVKTRMQSSGGGYTGMLDCAAKTLRRDGIGAFWRGTSPRLVRLTLSSGITFTVYDQVIQAARLFQMQPSGGLQSL